MKRHAAALLLVLGCSGKLFTITIRESADTVVERGTLLEDLVGKMGFGEFLNMDLTASEKLVNQGVKPGDIREVYLSDFVLTATDPPGADLSFLERVEVIVAAPGLDAVTIASADAFPEGLASVDFQLEDVDLTEYVVSQEMDISTKVTGRRPNQDVSVTADFAVDVGVTGQGVCNNL